MGFSEWAHSILALLCLTVTSAWAQGFPLRDGDTWDEDTKTLYVNTDFEEWEMTPYRNESDIVNLVISDDVTSIGESAFEQCTGLTSVTIGNSVTSIGMYAFTYCTNLATVTIGSGVTSIGNSAFNSCTSLATVTFATGSKLETIGNDAFLGCSFTTIDIPNGVTTIGAFAFQQSGLTSIVIPASVTSIGQLAFNNCTSLASVTIWAPSLGTYGTNAFSSCSSLTTINVPGGSIDEYRTGWSDYADKIKGFWKGTNITTTGLEGYWSTFYNSGCAVTVDENTQIYYISAIDGTNATLTKNATDKVITAGKAVILKSTAENVTLSYSSANSGCDYSGNQLTGVDVATTISGSAYANKIIYTLANESGLGFYKYTGSTLGANKAFLALDAEVGASARGFVFSFEEESTGIESLTTAPSEGESYYSLSGQRVLKPTKGLYIHNGKKIFVR